MIDVKTVEHIVIGIVGFLVLFNIYLNYNNIKNDTVNEILKKWAQNKYFFITFLWGVLGGHFFLGTRKAAFGSNWWIPVILVIVIAAILVLIGSKFKKNVVLKIPYQAVLLLSGVLYGHFIWSQRHIPTIDFPWS